MPLYDAVADLPLEVESYELERLEFAVSPEFTRVDHARASAWGRRGGRRRGRDVHGRRPSASGRPAARRLVHTRLVLAAPRTGFASLPGAGDGGLERLPPLGFRERGPRSRASSGRAVAGGRRRPRASPRDLRLVDALRRAPVDRAAPAVASGLSGPSLQARPDERLERGADRGAREPRRRRHRRPQGPVQGHRRRPVGRSRALPARGGGFPDRLDRGPGGDRRDAADPGGALARASRGMRRSIPCRTSRTRPGRRARSTSSRRASAA